MRRSTDLAFIVLMVLVSGVVLAAFGIGVMLVSGEVEVLRARVAVRSVVVSIAVVTLLIMAFWPIVNIRTIPWPMLGALTGFTALAVIATYVALPDLLFGVGSERAPQPLLWRLAPFAALGAALGGIERNRRRHAHRYPPPDK